jgi:hypothetical protein
MNMWLQALFLLTLAVAAVTADEVKLVRLLKLL